MTPEEIQQNIEAREQAEELMDLLESGQEDYSPRFWEELIKLAQSKLPAKPVKEVSTGKKYSYDEARFFASTYFPRGMYAEGEPQATPIRDVPSEYIIRWADGDEFTSHLRKYVASDYFQQRYRSE